MASVFSHLKPTGILKFLESIPIEHRHGLEHALAVAANAEIAKLAREAAALLAHPRENQVDIGRRLARIVSLAEPDKKFCATRLNTASSSRAIEAMAGPSADLGIPDFLRREQSKQVH